MRCCTTAGVARRLGSLHIIGSLACLCLGIVGSTSSLQKQQQHRREDLSVFVVQTLGEMHAKQWLGEQQSYCVCMQWGMICILGLAWLC